MNKMGEDVKSSKTNKNGKNNNKSTPRSRNYSANKKNLNTNNNRKKTKNNSSKKVFNPEIIDLPKDKVDLIKNKIQDKEEKELDLKDEDIFPKMKIKENNNTKKEDNNKNNEDTSKKEDNIKKENTDISSVPETKEKEEMTTEISSTEIKDETDKPIEVVPKKKKWWIIPLVLVIIGAVLLGVVLVLKATGKENIILVNKVNLSKVEVVKYDKDNGLIELVITPDSEQKTCALGDNKNDLNYVELVNNQCHIETTIDKHIVYFKNNSNLTSEALEVNDYVVDYGINDLNYLAVGSSLDVTSKMIVVGEPKVELKTNEEILDIDNNYVKGVKDGETKLQYLIDGQVMKEFTFDVTNLIVSMPKEFNSKKPYLSCNYYSKEQADTLDKILESRIAEAGYGTRAGAVAAARFLTLEFPYRISYFWENGRLSGTGTHIVDGEGRYYHKGLYLHESKIDDLKEGAYLKGPAIWGCGIVNLEPAPPNYIRGRKYPNGLDCSGFVSWALLNGGFDVGDIGAGDLPSDGQLTDVGEFTPLSKELIASNKIKVGDLFNIFGHISILVGIDDDNFYIAESLDTYKGLVLKKYAKTKVNNYFTHVVLMDELYKEDGNLTNLWY